MENQGKPGFRIASDRDANAAKEFLSDLEYQLHSLKKKG
jgi:hypothetical protein